MVGLAKAANTANVFCKVRSRDDHLPNQQSKERNEYRFKGAHRYMDGHLTVPGLLGMLGFMDLTPEQHNSKAWILGVAAALTIVAGYYGELAGNGDLTPRWICRAFFP